MTRKHRCRGRGESGTILLIAMFMIVVVSSLSAALFTASVSEMTHTQNSQDKSEWKFACEGAVDVATKEVLRAIANYRWVPEIPADATADAPSFAGVAPVTRIWSQGGQVQRETINVPFRVEMASWWDDESGTREYISRVDTDDQGVQTIIQPLNVIIPDPESDWQWRGITNRIEQVVEVGMTPIFQYAVFYNQDLELLPGPSMLLSGRVHSNNDLYVGCGGTLTINSDYFRSVGGMYRKRKNDGRLTNGTINILNRGTGGFVPMYSKSQLDALGVPSTSGFDSDFLGVDNNGDGDLNDGGDFPDFTVGSLTLWDGTVQTGAHGMTEVVPPDIGNIKRFAEDDAGGWSWDDGIDDWTYVGEGNGTHSKGRYYEEAGMTIVDGVLRDGDGLEMIVPPGAIQDVTMYDGRENQYVTVTEIDIEILKDNGVWPENGLLYAARTDSDPLNPNGIRLKNGSELLDRLTLVSENPVYVMGDYNSDDKKPAAILTDAINLLSNSWDDSKGSGNLPGASETTYNAAFITGAYETRTGVYNGGFENLPRFHENWSGVKANIRGSFVNIYDSDVGQGLWSYGGDNYRAPIRNWDYDTSFNSVGALPPFTPNVVEVTRVVSNVSYNVMIGP